MIIKLLDPKHLRFTLATISLLISLPAASQTAQEPAPTTAAAAPEPEMAPSVELQHPADPQGTPAPVDLVWPAHPPAQVAVKSETAYDALVRMSASPEESTRLAAIEGLAALENEEAVGIVLGALADESAAVRNVALTAIQKAPEETVFQSIVGILERGLGETSLNLDAALLQLSKPLAPRMTEILLSPEESLSRKCAAAYALGRMRSSSSAELLTELAWVGERQLAVFSAEALATLQDPATAEPLEQLLTHGNDDVRWCALQGLGKLGGPVAVRALTDLVTGDRERRTSIRQEAVTLLGEIGGAAVVPALIESMQHDINVREQAGAELRRITGQPIRNEPTTWLLWYTETQRAQAAADQPPPLVPSTAEEAPNPSE